MATGYVASLARPGGNVTGLSAMDYELSGKRLELLMEALRKASRVAVLWNPGNGAMVLKMKEVQSAAQAFGLSSNLWRYETLKILIGCLPRCRASIPTRCLPLADPLTLFSPRSHHRDSGQEPCASYVRRAGIC